MILAWPGIVGIFLLLSISSICNNVIGIPESNGIDAGAATKRKLKRTDATSNSRRQKRSKADKKDSYLAATEKISVECQNSSSLWCRIPAPKKSYFRFPEPPNDPYRWKRAQEQAASGEQVLLKKLVDVFPFYLNFLDGDVLFRRLHALADVFVDDNRDLSVLTGSSSRAVAKKKAYDYDSRGGIALPDPYNFRKRKRAAIVMFGYTAFKKGGNEYFEGHHTGGAYMERHHLLDQWRQLEKDKIDSPFILIHAHNENYGMLSTHFPNRTANWGICCSADEHKTLLEILNHDKLLLMLTNQHHNLSHPKLLTMPRGIPINGESSTGLTKKIVWDTMRTLTSQRKKKLIFSATSSAFHRLQIMDCISRKFSASDLEATKFGERHEGRLEPEQYYRKLGSSMLGLAMPGVGYDTFRLWETMTMGTVAVLEKGVGLDKPLWRLPALLVDDFDEVTPELLRAAYVEALYRVDEFEFERLTQSYWHALIGKVARSTSSQPVFDKFPPNEADDPTFCRPAVPFSCGPLHDQCGPDTKRTPKSYC